MTLFNAKGEALPDPIGQPHNECKTSWRNSKDIVAACADRSHSLHGIWRRDDNGFRRIHRT